MLALNEILKRLRPDLRFVPLENLIGLVVSDARFPRRLPPALAKEQAAVMKQFRVDEEDLPILGLQALLESPPERLELTQDFQRLFERAGTRMVSRAFVPTAQVMPVPGGPFGRAGKRRDVLLPRVTGLQAACLAASPFIGRGLVSAPGPARVGAVAAAVVCGQGFIDISREVFGGP